jgi:hypothetical protein
VILPGEALDSRRLNGSVFKVEVNENGTLALDIVMDEPFKYRDYKLFLEMSEFNSYDASSDRFLSMNQTRFYRLNNSAEEQAAADSISNSKGSLGRGAEVLGAVAVVGSPAMAGPFISLVAVIKLLDKVRFINVRYGIILGSFLDSIAGAKQDEDEDPTLKIINAENGKLTKLGAEFEVKLMTKIKVYLFLFFFCMRFLKGVFAK